MRSTGAVFAIALLACAHNVPQDKATSEDGKLKGAKPIELQGGEATESGIVTYPGGDRVDWKVVELPDKKVGKLDVTLSWKTPRPRLQLAFDVFDQWNKRVAESGKSTRSRSSLRHATVADAKGKYFIRVYAVGRGDAGRYNLELSFKENEPPFDWSKVAVDPPPRLADLPGIVVPCDLDNPDTSNKECQKHCWIGAPKNWKGCKGQCNVDPPDPAIPACAATMPCPTPKDRRVKSCVFPACPDPRNPDPNNPNCDNAPIPPVLGRIIRTEIKGTEVHILIAAGSKQGVGKDWSGQVLLGGTKAAAPTGRRAIAGGALVILDVDSQHTRARTGLTPQQLIDNSWVQLSAPPRGK